MMQSNNIPGTHPNHEPQQNPAQPPGEQDQNLGPETPDTEIAPDKMGNETEIDLDKSKTKTYPPERH